MNTAWEGSQCKYQACDATVDTYKQFVLRALERVVALEKGEPDEQTTDNVQHHLCHQVCRASPIVCEIAHE